MNRYFTLLLMMLFAVAAWPLRAAQSYANALKRAGDRNPVILFCYGANYDKISEQLYAEFIKNARSPVAKVLRGEVVAVVPIFQLPTEREQKEFNKATGGRGLPGGLRSFPCLAVVDGAGNLRGAVEGSDIYDAELAAKKLSSLLVDFKNQKKLLDKAQTATGNRKDNLTREALNIKTLRVPGHAMIDPANNGLVEKLQKMSIADANALIRGMIASGNYSPIERQMLMAAYAGHVRHIKGPVFLLRALYTEMRNIDPDSVYGAYAEGALELWVEPFEKDLAGKGGKKEADKPSEDAEAQ